MLILSRHVDEDIYIGPDIRIVVVAMHGGKVKIGIEAPADINIARGELLERDQHQPMEQHS